MPCTLRVFVFLVHLVQVLNVWLWLYVLRAFDRCNVYVIFRMPVVDILEHEWTVVFCRLNRDGQREPPLFHYSHVVRSTFNHNFPSVIVCQIHPFRVYIMIDLHIWITCSKSTWTVQPIISSICLIHTFHLSLSIASVSKALPVTLMTMPRTFLHMTLATSLFHLLT